MNKQKYIKKIRQHIMQIEVLLKAVETNENFDIQDWNEDGITLGEMSAHDALTMLEEYGKANAIPNTVRATSNIYYLLKWARFPDPTRWSTKSVYRRMVKNGYKYKDGDYALELPFSLYLPIFMEVGVEEIVNSWGPASAEAFRKIVNMYVEDERKLNENLEH